MISKNDSKAHSQLVKVVDEDDLLYVSDADENGLGYQESNLLLWRLEFACD